MGSQDSNCDSEGFPIDQDGAYVEFEVYERQEAPLIMDGSVFQELFSGTIDNSESPSHLEADMLEGEKVFASSSRGIPVSVFNENEVVVEEGTSSKDDEGTFNHSTSQAVNVVFEISKFEREELIAAKNRIIEMQRFMEEKGLSFSDFERAKLDKEREFNVGMSHASKVISGRDEYGLPIFTKDKPSKDATKVLDSLPKLHTDFSGEKHIDKGKNIAQDGISPSKTNTSGDTHNPPQTHLVECGKVTSSPVNNIVFDYCPIPAGASVVTPLEEVLQKGIDKFKCCIVRTFTKGALPFSKVVECSRAE